MEEFLLSLMLFSLAFWPLSLLLGPAVFLAARRWRWALWCACAVWVLLAVLHIAVWLAGMRPAAPFTEPFNTLAFLGVGLALLSAAAGPRVYRRFTAERERQQASQLQSIQNISPGSFEKLVMDTYRRLGFRAEHTGKHGDHGIDVVLYTREGALWIVQCKRYRGSVGEPVVRDLFGVLHHESAERAVLITSGTITPQARAWAKDKPIDLYDGKQFLRLARQAASAQKHG